MVHSHHEDLLKYWHEQEPLFQEVRKLGWQKYLTSLNLPRGFELKDRKLRCIDEGTPGGLHLAGSGILVSKSEAVDFVKQAGVTGIYSHAGCGAAALYAKNKGLDVDRADDYGAAWAQELAQITGLPYEGHIALNDLARPAEFHIARVIYYDASGSFDPSLVEGLPPGFVISRKYLSPAYAQQEVDIAAGIVLGEHGFKELVSSHNPIYVVMIGDNRSGLNLEALSQELMSVTKRYQGVVEVSGFLKP